MRTLKLTIILFITLQISINSIAEVNQENEKLLVLKGSESPWSIQAIFSYMGPSVNQPFSEYAPNPANELVPPRVNLSGTLSLRHRNNSKTSIGLGFGVQVDTPFHGIKNASASNPIFDFSTTLGDFFSISSLMLYSDLVWLNSGYQANLSESIFYSKRIDDISLGINFGFSSNYFSKFTPYQSDLSWGIYPFFEKTVSEKYSLRISSSFGQYRFVENRIWKDFVFSATIGFGFRLTNIYYFYPYVVIYPSPLNELSSDKTILGMSFLVNVF